MSSSATAKSGIKDTSSRLSVFHETQRNADRALYDAMHGKVSLSELVRSIRSAHTGEHELEQKAEADLNLFNSAGQLSFGQQVRKFIRENPLLESMHQNLEVGVALIVIGVARLYSRFSEHGSRSNEVKAASQNNAVEVKKPATNAETPVVVLSAIRREGEEDRLPEAA
ncbi:hypothetical protein M1394_02005 [Candidatus Marsarchaeota archaeon]|nr:hypothetical protein [Candidatus Marsarchaeota archaeon]